jgi:hypothetical protein
LQASSVRLVPAKASSVRLVPAKITTFRSPLPSTPTNKAQATLPHPDSHHGYHASKDEGRECRNH